MIDKQNDQGNGKKTGRLSDFVSGKGFYIVLILCLVAIGISGYIILSGSSEGNIDTTLSVATTAAPTAAQTRADAPAQEATPAQEAESGAEADDSASPSPGAQETSEEILIDSEAADYLPEEPTIMEEDMQTVEAMSPDDSLDAAAAEAAAEAAAAIIVWPLSGELQRDFSVDTLSYNETMSDWRVHQGIDIAAGEGSRVQAISGGTVTQVYEDDYLGTVVCVEHSGGLVSVYANLADVPAVSVGDVLSAGGLIGSVGATALGESGQEPHLHLELYRNGMTIDPLEYLP